MAGGVVNGKGPAARGDGPGCINPCESEMPPHANVASHPLAPAFRPPLAFLCSRPPHLASLLSGRLEETVNWYCRSTGRRLPTGHQGGPSCS
ncbi:uncharacterized protein [Triticum aestivum]|uniref:uncharacterized protein n=1 Tax=Triticum aestivum TaxID=4565 RepID=UPI001D012D2D|nr:uncharacterized protein LOC123139127 [Triticum aestivum]